MDIEEIREIIKNWAMRESLIRKAYIFGSRAREDYRSDSDIDVAVQLNKLPQDGSEYSTWMYTNKELTKSLQKILPFKLQLEWYCPKDTPTIHTGILQSSILVYEQEVT